LIDKIEFLEELMNIPRDVRQFLEDILEDAGYPALTREVKEQMLQDLYLRLDNKLIAAALENLPEEHLEAFDTMLENQEGADKINAFLAEKIPHIKELFGQAMLDFRRSYLGG